MLIMVKIMRILLGRKPKVAIGNEGHAQNILFKKMKNISKTYYSIIVIGVYI